MEYEFKCPTGSGLEYMRVVFTHKNGCLMEFEGSIHISMLFIFPNLAKIGTLFDSITQRRLWEGVNQ